MSYTAPAMEATIKALAQAAPKTWARIVDAAIEIDADELASLQALPSASSLVDGQTIRVLGLANAVMHAVDDIISAQINALQNEAARLRVLLDEAIG